MKKFYFVILSFLCFALISCNGFEIQPLFISVFGADLEQGKVNENYVHEDDNSIIIYFSKSLKLKESSISTSDGRVIAHAVEYLDGSEKDSDISLRLKVEDFIPIGQEYNVFCQFQGGNSTQEITLTLNGKNTLPAILKLSEYKPNKKTTTVPYSRFIELIVVESGNLFNTTLGSLGPSKTRDYTFPACEVTKGEIIVVHLNPSEEGKSFDLIVDELGENIRADISTARDFYTNWSSNPSRTSDLILVEDSNGNIQDYFYYNNGANEFKDDVFTPAAHIENYVDRLLASPFKEEFFEKLDTCENLKATSTYSFSRVNGKWVSSKDITPGIKNE